MRIQGKREWLTNRSTVALPSVNWQSGKIFFSAFTWFSVDLHSVVTFSWVKTIINLKSLHLNKPLLHLQMYLGHYTDENSYWIAVSFKFSLKKKKERILILKSRNSSSNSEETLIYKSVDCDRQWTYTFSLEYLWVLTLLYHLST